MLIIAIVLITLALIFYTTGVWAEKLGGRLKRWHAGAFLAGLAFDASGTAVMVSIAESGGARQGGTAGGLTAVMAWTGGLALVLMAIHAVWAIVVLVRGRESELANFHKLSLWVWLIWLIPYATGMLSAML